MFSLKFSYDFTFATVFALLIGIYFGIFITFLIYVNSIFKTINKEISSTKKKINDDKNSNKLIIIEEKVQKRIKEAQETFKYKTKHNKIKGMDLLFPYSNGKINKNTITYNLVNSIAIEFNPKSTNPLSEITIEETLDFIKSITFKIEQLLSLPSVHFLKKLKINTIINIINVVEYIEKNKIFKIYNSNKKYINILLFILKILNPVTWIKKLAIQPVIKLLSGKIISSLIEFIGLEAFELYSKHDRIEKVNKNES